MSEASAADCKENASPGESGKAAGDGGLPKVKSEKELMKEKKRLEKLEKFKAKQEKKDKEAAEKANKDLEVFIATDERLKCRLYFLLASIFSRP